MALSTAKLTELPPHLLFTFSVAGRGRPPQFPVLCGRFSFSHRSVELFSTASKSPNSAGESSSPSASWIKKWPSTWKVSRSDSRSGPKRRELKLEAVREGTTAIDRIVLRLRNLGLGSDDEEEGEGAFGVNEENADLKLGGSADSEYGNEKLGDLLKRDWVRPDTILVEDDDDDDDLLPWEREDKEDDKMEDDNVGVRKRAVRAPTIAELTIEDEELRRLRRMGMTLRERISVPKAGVTGEVLEKIHDKWRRSELVRLKFHETLAHDMKTAHEIVEVSEFLQ